MNANLRTWAQLAEIERGGNDWTTGEPPLDADVGDGETRCDCGVVTEMEPCHGCGGCAVCSPGDTGGLCDECDEAYQVERERRAGRERARAIYARNHSLRPERTVAESFAWKIVTAHERDDVDEEPY